jgi:hypothetical protein
MAVIILGRGGSYMNTGYGGGVLARGGNTILCGNIRYVARLGTFCEFLADFHRILGL